MQQSYFFFNKNPALWAMVNPTDIHNKGKQIMSPS